MDPQILLDAILADIKEPAVNQLEKHSQVNDPVEKRRQKPTYYSLNRDKILKRYENKISNRELYVCPVCQTKVSLVSIDSHFKSMHHKFNCLNAGPEGNIEKPHVTLDENGKLMIS